MLEETGLIHLYGDLVNHMPVQLREQFMTVSELVLALEDCAQFYRVDQLCSSQ